MKHRCTYPSNPKWASYGGRGIKVCDRWQDSFPAFLEDMGPRPSPKHSIDRIDFDGNYEPTNCRWTTSTTQTRNKGTTRTLTYEGETLCLADWAERFGVGRGTVHYRLSQGWTFEEAFGPVPKPPYGTQRAH
jgi:hypothetical protein